MRLTKQGKLREKEKEVFSKPVLKLLANMCFKSRSYKVINCDWHR